MRKEYSGYQESNVRAIIDYVVVIREGCFGSLERNVLLLRKECSGYEEGNVMAINGEMSPKRGTFSQKKTKNTERPDYQERKILAKKKRTF